MPERTVTLTITMRESEARNVADQWRTYRNRLGGGLLHRFKGTFYNALNDALGGSLGN